ncbi:MAG: hypothetical protein MI922_27110 [Bacteroidales bacterium]|nr:hypothetical protein [Bacteroidales bacterium]
MNNKVVITGIGSISPLGIGTDLLWNSYKNFMQSGDKSVFENSNIDLEAIDICKYLKKNNPNFLDRVTFFLIISAFEALQNAEVDLNYTNTERFGIVTGTKYGPIDTLAKYYKGLHEKGPNGVSPILFPSTVINLPASQVGIEYSVHGPNITLTQGDSSGIDALGMAYGMIKRNECDIILCCSGDANTDLMKKLQFNNGDEDKHVSEGAVSFIIESYEHAINRGAHIHAQIGGYNNHICDINGESKQDITNLYDSLLGGKSDEIDAYFGTYDQNEESDIEFQATRDYFADNDNIIATSSKQSIGDYHSVSGLHNVLFALKSMSENEVSGYNLSSASNSVQQKKEIRRALCNAFSKEGLNSSLIIEHCN